MVVLWSPLLVSLLLISDLWSDFSRIATMNAELYVADAAYRNKDYRAAAFHYSRLVDSLKADDPRLVLNCGHAWFRVGSKRRAWQYYSRLSQERNKQIQSVAWTQLGFMVKDQPARALSYFRSALHANPNNDEARYNYELLKLLHPNADPPRRPQKPQDQQKAGGAQGSLMDKQKQGNPPGADPNKGGAQGDGQPQDQNPDGQGKQAKKPGANEQGKEASKDKTKSEKQNKPQADGDKKGDAPPDERNPDMMQANKADLDKLKMSEEQARALLDAMKNSEVQYLQQRKYPKTQKNSNPNKPIW